MLIKVILAERSGEEFAIFHKCLRNAFLSSQTFLSFSVFPYYLYWICHFHQRNLYHNSFYFRKKKKKRSNAFVKFLARWTINQRSQVPPLYHIGTLEHLDANRKLDKTRKARIVLVRCVHNVAYNTPWNTAGGLAAFSDLFMHEYGAAYWLYTRTLFSPPLTTVSWLLTFSLPRFSAL